jgi:hypothetical protein
MTFEAATSDGDNRPSMSVSGPSDYFLVAYGETSLCRSAACSASAIQSAANPSNTRFKMRFLASVGDGAIQ